MAFQDFDLIQERRRLERQQKFRKRITVAIVSVFVLFALVGAAMACVIVLNKEQQTKDGKKDAPTTKSTPSAKKSNDDSSKQTVIDSDKAIKTICATTDYQYRCETSLSDAVKAKEAHISKPVEFLKASISSASEQVDKVIKSTTDIKIEDPMAKAALNDCLTLFNDSKEELNSSIVTTEGIGVKKLASESSELNNWLSAVISYQQTCIDGIPDGEQKNIVEKSLKVVKELTSNSLALVSGVAPLAGAAKQRRLLATMSYLDEDGFPTWMDQESRRVLKADIPKLPPNAIVAKDGSGNFTTINAALAAIPKDRKGRYIIYVKAGIYDENVIVDKKMVNITMYGDGSQKSVVQGNKNFVDGVPTFQTATFAAIGEGFIAQSLGFRNIAGPEKHQAVALRVQSDRSIFLNCRMEGYQDTLYAQTHRQFYRSCYITGTIDFIFGDAAAVFQNCMIYVRKPMDNQQNIVTAQGRVDRHETTGIVLQNCRILADDQLELEKSRIKSYLGRPWKEYSRTIVMESEIGDFIHPDGWLPWEGDFALKTLYYGEFNNKGPGSPVTARVKWPGYKKISRADAMKFTVGPFLQGEVWLKGAQIPIRFGLFK